MTDSYMTNCAGFIFVTTAGTDRLDKDLTIGQMQGESCAGVIQSAIICTWKCGHATMCNGSVMWSCAVCVEWNTTLWTT